ncbi:unnamed protein product [Ectocarpus sp. 12 AP-2014]
MTAMSYDRSSSSLRKERTGGTAAVYICAYDKQY